MALALVLVLLVLGLVVVNTWGALALNGLSTLYRGPRNANE
jgi:hypothetical protein